MHYHTLYTEALPQRYWDRAFYSFYTTAKGILRVHLNHQLVVYLNSGHKDMHQFLIILIGLSFLFYSSGVFQMNSFVNRFLHINLERDKIERYHVYPSVGLCPYISPIFISVP